MRLEADKEETAQCVSAFMKKSEARLSAIQIRLQQLFDGFLEQDIERETYRARKAKMLSEKKSLEEQIAHAEK
jgi:hypothetical protein